MADEYWREFSPRTNYHHDINRCELMFVTNVEVFRESTPGSRPVMLVCLQRSTYNFVYVVFDGERYANVHYNSFLKKFFLHRSDAYDVTLDEVTHEELSKRTLLFFDEW